MKNLTRREQILLFVLLCIVFIAGFFLLVIQPLDKKLTLNRTKLTELENTKADIELKFSMEPSIDTNLKKAIASVSDKFDRIESPLFAADFERWSLPYLAGNGVTMTGLTVSDPELSSPDVPTYQEIGFEYELRGLVDSFNKAIKKTTSIPVTEVQLVRTTVEFKFLTSYPVFQKFLDEIAFWDTTAFVSNSSYDFTQSSGMVRVVYYTSEKIITETTVD